MGNIIQIMRGYVHHTNVCIVGLPVVAMFGKQHKQNGRYLTISQKLRVVELSFPTLYMGNSSVTHVTFFQFLYFHRATIKYLVDQSNKSKAYDDLEVQFYITT